MSDQTMFQELVAFLNPFFFQASERVAILLNAFHDHTDVLSKIDFEGAATVFVPHLVHVLQHHGEITPHTQALWQLLLTLRAQRGSDVQEKIDSFQAWANASHPVTLEPHDQRKSRTAATNQITINASVKNSIISAGSIIQVSSGHAPKAAHEGSGPADNELLAAFIDNLKITLQSLSTEQREVAQLVSTRSEQLMYEMHQADFDHQTAMRKADRLQQAAAQLREALPMVSYIGEHISRQALKIIEAQ